MDYINYIYDCFATNPKYVYKSCQKDWIVILQKLHDTITNESRKVDNPKYAKYRGNKFKTILIFNKFHPHKTCLSIKNSIFSSEIEYVIGQIIFIKDYDMNFDNICSTGIHYFKTIEQSFYFEISKMLSGKFMLWYDDGCKLLETEIVNGNFTKKFTKWYKNGIKEAEGEYDDGKKIGKWTGLHENGVKKAEGYYMNGKKIGEWIEWNYDGIKVLIEEYDEGHLKKIRTGVYIEKD